MLWLLLGAALLSAAVPTPSAAGPIPEPLIFDFEDGLQGWVLSGSAQRVQTQLLGGEWAILGDGFVGGPTEIEHIDGVVVLSGTAISNRIDLTEFASISVEQRFVDGNEEGFLFFLGIDLIENIFIGTLSPLELIESGNPSVGSVDLIFGDGVKDIGFFWGFGSESGSSVPPLVAFIDNITFHPVPESSTLLLLSLGLPALVIARRCAVPCRAVVRTLLSIDHGSK